MNDLISKYKPKNIDEMLLNPELRLFCKIFIEEVKGRQNQNMNYNHLLLDGLSGIGKTSLAILLAKEIGLPFKEFNASDIRGINIIDDILIFYKINCKQNIIIILDESDNLTLRGQELIIHLMDNYSKILLFFTSNKKEDILIDIYKRVYCINMQYFSLQTYSLYFEQICIKENIKLTKNNLHKIIEKNEYDIRKILNELDNQMTIKKNTICHEKIIFHSILDYFYKFEDMSDTEFIDKIVSKNILSNLNYHDCLEYLCNHFGNNNTNKNSFCMINHLVMNSFNNYSDIDFIYFILKLRNLVNRKSM